MANTYTLINSTSLSTTAASVTFSAIPATYDDLEIQISSRSDSSALIRNMQFTVNGTNTASRILLEGTNNVAVSSLATAQTSFRVGPINAATSTASTFSSSVVYIPKYAGSTNKPMSIWLSMENNNATDAYIDLYAALQSQTTAIDTLTFTTTGNFVSGSTFWLYGIKNS